MKRILLTTLCLLTLLSLALACLSCKDQTPPDVPPDGPSTEDDQTNNQGTTDTPDAPSIPTQPDADAAYVFARGEKGDFMPLKHYPADDLIICSKNVLDYGAQPDGSKDATKAFQRALDAVATMGGGTVYAPAGQYYFTDRLLIPDAVTLCGDWVSPEEEAAGTRGTVLIFDYKSRTPQAQYGYINLGSSSGLRNVTVYHKNHSFEKPLKLAPTVWGYNHTTATVENVTILNAYVGMSFGEAEGSNSSLVTLSNVYISALNCGILSGNSYDVSRIEGVHVSPEYLADNAIAPMTDAQKSALYNYTFANATGMKLYRGDATGIYDTYLAYQQTGILFDEDPGGNGVTSGSVIKTEIYNCNVGILVENAHFVGTSIIGLKAHADRICEAAILTGERYTYHTKVEDGEITGKYKTAAQLYGKSALTFTDVRFAIDSKDAVIAACNGMVSCTACTFENDYVVTDDGGATAIYLTDCTVGGEMRTELGAASQIKVAQGAAEYQPITAYHTYRETLPMPAGRVLINILDYGARADGKADNTKAIQDALDAAAAAGGGVVLVPNGKFAVMGYLRVPTGVTLSGTPGVWGHSGSSLKSSSLLLYAGKNDPKGTAAISLEKGSGLRSLTAWYPEQDIDNIVKYSYTVRSLGEDVSITNVNICNAYQYMDLGTHPSRGHYVRNCGGTAILRGMYVGNNDGEGWIENVHLNQHQMYGLHQAGQKGGYAPDQFDHAVYDILIWETDGFVFGYNKNEHVLGTFCLGAYAVYRFEAQDGKGTTGTFVQIGADGCRDSIVIDDADDVKLIVPGCVSLGDDSSRSYLRTGAHFDGEVSLWGGSGYGAPTQCMILGGGRVNVSTFTFASFAGATPVLLGGEVDLQTVSCMLPYGGSSAKATYASTYDGLVGESATLVAAPAVRYGYDRVQMLNR